MPKVTGNDLVVQTLKNEGVDTVFYLTGGPMSDVAGLCLEMQFKSIDVRHEQAAAMMAHAYSRLTGKPGICFAASGPGTTNLLTGIGNSFLDATPVVALGGSSPLTQNSRGAFQEMDQVSIFKPVTKWAERVTDTRRIPELISKAIRMATQGQQGPVYLDLPGDILALLTVLKKWTFNLLMKRAASGRHVFEANVNRFALILQVHGTKPLDDLAQQASIRKR
jgi:acetolactate synthase-1/2/3 large subunit